MNSPSQVQETLTAHGYYPSSALATALFLTIRLERPLFLEGEPGVGKTELAKVIASALGRPLLRLQCYEGLDRQAALYEWNYQKQLLHIRVAEAVSEAGTANSREMGNGGGAGNRDGASNGFNSDINLLDTGDTRDNRGALSRGSLESELFSEEFLLKRPLLAAIDFEGPAPVLLIDEVDRADEAFEAFLLELLGEFQVTIPELGTIKAKDRPVVILTSNRTREVHDALKRRCFYQWIDYPEFDRELEILLAKVPEVAAEIAHSAVALVQRLREEPLFKRPGVAETVHWAEALAALGTKKLHPEIVEQTLGCLLKYKDDFDFLTQRKGEAGSRISTLVTEAERQ
ncbi:AAA family ATPase [Alicyclobacillus ferrooxydans]|uniref:ATPase n=1 Tax=Alicyclobacillus ferrooxydans TaxID=471514 RepID=A0A0P9CVT2_9BACL|nr:MoxR family ATPase [Alicyclobacillus ferrooxydans]KPV40761.1 ATPase [Alicyclobacillus ferrooxydans]